MGFKLDPETEAKALALAGLPALAPGVTEAEFQRRVMREAKRRGWLAYHTHDSRRSEPGFPDLVMLRAGRLLFAELKSAAGAPTDAQAEWLAALRAVEGAEVYLWRPADWPQIMEALK